MKSVKQQPDYKKQCINNYLQMDMEYKAQFIPESLYKYRIISNNNINNLLNDILWLADPNTFNDPYDSSLMLDYSQLSIEKLLKDSKDLKEKYSKHIEPKLHLEKEKETFERMFQGESLKQIYIDMATKSGTSEKEININIKIFKEIIEHQINDLATAVRNNFRNSLKICSFTEYKDNLLMWSHYANNHTGFCIEYNFKELGNDDLRKRLMFPVVYTDYIFKPDKYEVDVPLPFYALTASLFKSPEWEYESEWRLIIPGGMGGNYVQLPRLKALYLGTRIADEHKKELLKIAKYKRIDIYQMKMKYDKFKLYPEKLDTSKISLA